MRSRRYQEARVEEVEVVHYFEADEHGLDFLVLAEPEAAGFSVGVGGTFPRRDGAADLEQPFHKGI